MYNHLTLQMYDPTLARSDYVGTAEHSPTIHNRGAVAHPAKTPGICWKNVNNTKIKEIFP